MDQVQIRISVGQATNILMNDEGFKERRVVVNQFPEKKDVLALAEFILDCQAEAIAKLMPDTKLKM